MVGDRIETSAAGRSTGAGRSALYSLAELGIVELSLATTDLGFERFGIRSAGRRHANDNDPTRQMEAA